MFFPRIVSSKPLNGKSKMHDCQLLTLIFVCRGIYYNQKFVLYNKFTFNQVFHESGQKFLFAKVFISKVFEIKVESLNGVFIIFLKNSVNETFVHLTQINLGSGRSQRHIQNPVKSLRWSFLGKKLTALSRLLFPQKNFILDL